MTDAQLELDMEIDPTPPVVRDLHTKVHEALGAASMCWENPGGAGEFISEQASKIGEDLMVEILSLSGLGMYALGAPSPDAVRAVLRERFGGVE